jgi:hypothetical protein
MTTNKFAGTVYSICDETVGLVVRAYTASFRNISEWSEPVHLFLFSEDKTKFNMASQTNITKTSFIDTC